jgi:integrase
MGVKEGTHMSLSQMKADLHDRLWNAQQRWFEMCAEGWTKHEVKMAGVKDANDQNFHMRPILFAGRSRVTYERILKSFLTFAHERFDVQRLDDIDTKHAKAFLDDGIQRGLAAKTLHTQRSALAKAFALVGKTASGAALSRKYGEKIRDLVTAGSIAGPERATPSPEVVQRAIEILRGWDLRHQERTKRPRAYHVVARLQVETAARGVSSTTRLRLENLKEGNVVEIVGKGGQALRLVISPDLYVAVQHFLSQNPGILADRDGYRTAWRRAIMVAGGRVTGTHGLRRRSAQDFYRTEYRKRLAAGASPAQARREARAETVERLGHSRDRVDQASCYLGPAA